MACLAQKNIPESVSEGMEKSKLDKHGCASAASQGT
jgi:hypothetical protein